MKIRKWIGSLSTMGVLVGIIILMTSLKLQAQPTQIIVRAKAKDAKFLPESLGVYVTIRDHLSGEILAKGKAKGGSGNTARIMADAIPRQQQLADENTSKYEATIDLQEPTFVDIEVTGSTNRKNGTRVASTQLWLIPGKHMVGDGIVLEISGFIVDILAPTTQQYIRLADIESGELPIRASVTMACGCVIASGATWNADDYLIAAIIKHQGQVVGEIPMTYTGTWNNFHAALPISEKGDYEVQVYAYDGKTCNTGVDIVNFTVM